MAEENLIALKKDANGQENGSPKQIKVSIPNGMNILFSDSVFMTLSPHGDVLIDFAQSMGPSSQQNIVARIGLSKEHAKSLVSRLDKMIDDLEGEQKKDD